ncbi:MAG: peptidyl-prolyl cis-trans isomerase [Acidobacteria bacterium]|nr:peptidyl-prolyl cis-trans isomerase [Acidobacteriota bacterium]
MQTSTRRVPCLALAGALLWAAAAGTVHAQGRLGGDTPESATGIVLQRILARVNGDIITQTDLENRQVAMLRQENFVPVSEAALRRKLVEVTPRVISNAVDELLLVQRGRVLGYYLSDEQFAEMVASIKEENGFDSDADFEEALLQAEGMTVTDFRRSMEHRILVNQVQQIEIVRKVLLTETEAREYYDANLDQYAEVPTVTLREILIAVPETPGSFSVGNDDLARAAAEEARQRVVDGEDFSAVAIGISDAPSKANGGLIGPLDYAILSETVQQVIDGLEVGGISAPIRTPGGFQVLLLEARTEATPLPFEEVKNSIMDNVFNDRRWEEFTRYLEELRGEAVIDWKDEELRRAYERYEPERTSPTRPGNN